MSWTRPICDPCWEERNPGLEPLRLSDPNKERCCYCHKATRSGIYIRVDPSTLPQPPKHLDPLVLAIRKLR